ncbi:GNAT family N-acetyltransferase [Dysgonomonas sp. OttesenSCG-928-M03]|nr:GNAT family N-acetyltransferase [Dysgonomonas sp. OttesenSCG-928-M03]
MKIISVRKNPEYKGIAIKYFQDKWSSVYPAIYEDCIEHSLNTTSPLPQWYLLKKDNEIIGCAGVITNDFISRMDLYPWICAVYIEENQRGHSYAALLLEKAKIDMKDAGFEAIYLSTSHIGFYEKYGFEYIGQGYHPWGESSRIYQAKLI